MSGMTFLGIIIQIMYRVLVHKLEQVIPVLPWIQKRRECAQAFVIKRKVNTSISKQRFFVLFFFNVVNISNMKQNCFVIQSANDMIITFV